MQLWVTDVDNGLRAFYAVPSSNGTLVQIPIPPTGGIQKYQRPAFGDGRVYVMGGNKITCLGAPVNLPLRCSSPVAYGSLSIGQTETLTVNCTALVAITQINGCTVNNPYFQCSNASLPSGSLAVGQSFSFPVTWNLTNASIQNAPNVSYGKVIPGAVTGALTLATTNGIAGYTTSVPVSLTGQIISSNPFLHSTPSEIDMGGLVFYPNGSTSLASSVIVQNIGNSTLTFTGFAWQDSSANATDTSYHNLTLSGSNTVVGTAFTSSTFPAVGQTLDPGSSLTVPLAFQATVVGKYASLLTLWSDGGFNTILILATAVNPPVANISVSTSGGGWNYSVPVAVHFGNILANTTVQQSIRVCNQGGSALTITRSKVSSHPLFNPPIPSPPTPRSH